ncbi:MAG: phosphatase, partial [Peptostreptococcaceae bacterium]
KILIDLHTHTIVSGHAYSTVEENIKSAKEKGLKYLGMSEHGPIMPGGAHPFYFSNIFCIPREIDGVNILRGAEANILNENGDIDLSDFDENLDYMIASLHTPCIKHGTIEENTNAVINAMKHKKVKVIGHLDDSRYKVDYEKVVLKAKEENVIFEINNSSLKPQSFRVGAWDNVVILLDMCKKHNVDVIMGSDAHISFDIANLCYSEEIIKKCDFPLELVVNYHEEKIKKYFGV